MDSVDRNYTASFTTLANDSAHVDKQLSTGDENQRGKYQNG